MKTIKLYQMDAFMQTCHATVIDYQEVNGKIGYILDQTVFYPTGGGQPNDLGKINDLDVVDVIEKDDEIYHIINGNLNIGDKVNCAIDFERRFDHMQQHSGEHIISGILCQLYQCDNVGFHLGKDEVVIDYNTILDAKQIEEAEKIANQAIYENTPSNIFILDKDIDYRSKKELFGDIRIVEFGKYDRCACCGTHVLHAGQVGMILVTGFELIKKGTRIHILCGKRAMDYTHKLLEDEKKVSALVSLPISKTASGVEKLIGQISELQAVVSAFKKNYIHDLAAKLNGEVVFYEDDQLDFNSAKDLVNELGERKMIIILFNGQFILASNNNVNPFLGLLRKKYNVKGGGKNQFAQGKIEAHLEEIQLAWEEFNHE